MKFLKTLPNAGAWVLLLVGSSVLVSFLASVVMPLMNVQWAIEHILWFNDMIVAFSNGTSIDQVFQMEHARDVCNFLIVLTFISYIPVLIVGGVKAVRTRTMYKRFETDTLLLCLFSAAFFNMVLEIAIALLSPLVPDATQNSFEFTMAMTLKGAPILVVILAGVVAPVIEEIVLRYGVQKSLQRWNPIGAIIITSISFGILHGNIIQGVFAFFAGLLLGFFYYKTDNLLYSTVMHMLINTSGCIAIYSGINEFVIYAGIAVLAGVVLLIVMKIKRRDLKTMLEVRTLKEDITQTVSQTETP